MSIHPSIAGMSTNGGWGLAWFVVLYCFAAWMRLYYNKNNKVLGKAILFIAIPVLVTAALFVANHLHIGIAQSIIRNWYRYDSALVVVMSLILMSIFLNIEVKSMRISRLITKIAPLTLGVYLIHAHADVSPWSWKVINLPQYMSNVTFPLVQIVAVLVIFLLCIVIDFVRQSVFKNIRLSRYMDWIDNKCKSLFGV